MLLIDIGVQRMCAMVFHNNTYNAYMFGIKGNMVENLVCKFDKILAKNVHVQRVVIEQQMPNSININIQSMLLMYFYMKALPCVLQAARSKYKHLTCDRRNYKIAGVLDCQKRGLFDNVYVYMLDDSFGKQMYVEHKYYDECAKYLAKKYNLEKLDEISDTILMSLVV